MPTRRPSTGYSLEWLQNISLSGLQKLARAHGIDHDASCEEIIQELRVEEEGEEGDEECADEEQEFFTSSASGAQTHEEESEEVEDSTGDEDHGSKDDAHDEKEKEVPGDGGAAAAAAMPDENPAAAVKENKVSDIKPWAAAPFVPAKSDRPLTYVQPFAASQPLSARGDSDGAITPRSIEVAARKQLDDARKVEAGARRREAAAERRARISTAFNASQVNAYGGPQRISNKPRAAWEQATAVHRQQAVSSARAA